MKTFKDLMVWQKAHSLVLSIYKITKTFPSDEKFGLISQLRRSASSIPTNIVEGFKRRSRKEFLHFLNLSDASLEETKYHLILSKDLGYLSTKEFENITANCEEIGKMLFGLQKNISSKLDK